MRIGRWFVLRLPRNSDPLRYLSDAQVAARLLIDHPSGSIVRNTRTGENVGIEVWLGTGRVNRGVGSIAKAPVLPEDIWLVLTNG